MSHVYVIEIAGRAVGLVARQQDGESFRFHAAIPGAYSFDSQVFATPEEARRALLKGLGRTFGKTGRTLGKAA